MISFKPYLRQYLVAFDWNKGKELELDCKNIGVELVAAAAVAVLEATTLEKGLAAFSRTKILDYVRKSIYTLSSLLYSRNIPHECLFSERDSIHFIIFYN